MANLKNTKISDTGFLQLPAGTTAQRPANPHPEMARINTDIDNIIEFWDGDKWAVAGDNFLPMQATGGTVTNIIQDGIQYRVHSFVDVGSHTFEVQSLGSTDGEVEYLVVGGEGGGGSHTTTLGGGAGGAGGYRCSVLGEQSGAERQGAVLHSLVRLTLVAV